MDKQNYRYLRGYTLDPGFSTRLDTMTINETVYRIRWEDLTTPASPPHKTAYKKLGPVGEYFEVIDIDPASHTYYEPVDLDDIGILSQSGLKPSEGNPQFHQQFVYTIAMKTLEQFEKALGRPVIWSPKRTYGKKDEYVGQIRLYPHAFRDANAYYATDKKAILFGYFKAALQIQGTNFPGGAVFTSLSPDIIAHETTHALLDSVHPRFLEDTNRDVPAFHEGFADIIALLQRFTIKELIVNQISTTGGNLDNFNYLGELATQFGSALALGRGALRSAIGYYDKNDKWQRRQPDPSLYQLSNEPHERGSILVATFFDALIKVYNFKTADLIRIATGGTGVLPQGAIPVDLAKRLAGELCEIAEHLLSVAIRALDYCPPVDITFGDYLRALITADMEFARDDENNYRIALIDAFRSWGIFPDQVNTFSEESLQWSKPDLNTVEGKALKLTADFLKLRVRRLASISNRKSIWGLSQQIQAELHGFLLETKKQKLDPEQWEQWLNKLGLTARGINFQDILGTGISEHDITNIPIEIHKVRPAYRVGKQGLILEQVIVSITQSIKLKIDNGGPEPQTVKFRGGSTIIFDRTKDFSLSYIITKSILNQDRLREQLNYQNGSSAESASFTDSMYEDNNGYHTINFAHLHFH